MLYLHSVPTSSDDWLSPLAVTGGVAVDLPGCGRSGKGGHLDYSLNGYVTFLERFTETVSPGPISVVGHGWGGALALLLAGRVAVERLVLVDAVPLLPGFAWPGIVRWWRRPVAGELLMGSISRRLLARGLRRGSVTERAWPDDRIDAIWEQFDQGTQRAILRLHRSVDEARLVEAGSVIAELRQPALVLWGEQDPWLPARFAQAYGQALGHATVETVAGAGHWPWLDRPELADRLAAFLA